MYGASFGTQILNYSLHRFVQKTLIQERQSMLNQLWLWFERAKIDKVTGNNGSKVALLFIKLLNKINIILIRDKIISEGHHIQNNSTFSLVILLRHVLKHSKSPAAKQP